MEIISLFFSQSTGQITNENGRIITSGWSGHGEGKNNPSLESAKFIGPLPRGKYAVGLWQEHPRLGLLVVPLRQIEGESFGRSDFWIHGPSLNPSKYGQESDGCVVVPREGREEIKSINPYYFLVIE